MGVVGALSRRPARVFEYHRQAGFACFHVAGDGEPCRRIRAERKQDSGIQAVLIKPDDAASHIDGCFIVAVVINFNALIPAAFHGDAIIVIGISRGDIHAAAGGDIGFYSRFAFPGQRDQACLNLHVAVVLSFGKNARAAGSDRAAGEGIAFSGADFDRCAAAILCNGFHARVGSCDGFCRHRRGPGAIISEPAIDPYAC